MRLLSESIAVLVAAATDSPNSTSSESACTFFLASPRAQSSPQYPLQFSHAHAPHAPLSFLKINKQSFKLHIGGEITLPTRFQAPSSPPCSSTSSSTSANDFAAAAAAEAPRLHDPFEGVPLRAWAERLGERVMPAYEAVKAEEARRKAEALAAKGNSGGASASFAVVAAPLSVPSVFPLTRWAASSPAVRSTLVAADDPKERPKARLSWYHPDDTMVPR